MNDDRLRLAHIYIKKLRNEEKQAYAHEYLSYLLGASAESPSYPFDRLGAMAQQAVRMHLGALVPAELIVPRLHSDEVDTDTPGSTAGEAQHWEQTKCGEQGVLIHTQRTQKNYGARRSAISTADQVRGTMFDVTTVDSKQTQLF